MRSIKMRIAMRKTILFIFSFLSLVVYSQNTNFVKVFNSSSDEFANKVVQLSSGDYYILSTTESYGAGNKDILVTKTNGLGDVIWSYAFGTSGNEVGTSLRLATDGGILITGYSDNISLYSDAAFILKLTSSGAETFNKTITYDSTVRAYDIVESRFGGYYVTGHVYLDSLDDNVFLTSMSSTGNIFWTKTYGGIKKDHAYSIAEDGKGRLIIAGSTMNDSIINGSTGDMDIQLMRLRTNGNVVWTRNYGTNTNQMATYVRSDNNSNLYLTGHTEGGPMMGENMFLTKLDSTGNVSSSFMFGTDGDDRGYALNLLSNGDVNLTGKIQGVSSSGDFAVLRVNSSGAIVNSSILGGDSSDGMFGVDAFLAPDGGVTVLSGGKSYLNSNNYNLYMIKTESNGVVGCGSKLDFVNSGQFSLSTNAYQNTTTISTGANVSFTKTTVSLADTMLCCKLNARIAADTITMCTGDQIRLGRASISGYQYSWTAIGSSFTSSVANPQVSPASDITYKLVVTEANGVCISDSATVHVIVNSRLNVDFARDSFFCEGQSVTVEAYPGQNSYTWTGDGYTYSGAQATFSLDDTIVLRVIDNNSCVYLDTIAITEIPTPTFSLGPDTTICSNLSITLEGPANMYSYNWNGTTGSNRYYTTSIQKIHSLTVVDSFGCTANDLIIVQTKPFSTFTLGADTSICESSVFTIFGPGALTNYIWNDTASTVQNLEVNEGGTYHLTAFNSFGCPYSDTIVISEWSLPVFSLGNDTYFCEGSYVVLQGPASGVDQYLWSTSSEEDTTWVSTAGDYTLQVTDFNGCRYTDTINVTESPAPVISLGDDTTLCIGQTLVLTPGSGFSSYQWSTSETTASISVNSVGTYSVTVTDTKGCEGSASINVDTMTCSGGSVQYLGKHQLRMYPNPASTQLTLDSDISLMGAVISLYDALGKEVIQIQAESHKVVLEVADLTSGIYNLSVAKDNMKVYYRVIVAH